MDEIYVIKSTYEKTADGIKYFTDKQKLAEAVYGAEEQGATVQVFKCVPVKHEVQIERVGIEFYEEKYL
jgi:hypothetical protein